MAVEFNGIISLPPVVLLQKEVLMRGILWVCSYTEVSEDKNQDYLTESWDSIFYS